MKVVVGGIKGGSGKSTIATNLAVMRSKKGFKTVLIDGDDQKSTTDWAIQREAYFKKHKKKKNELTTVTLEGLKVLDFVNRNSKKYDDFIIDVGGRDTASQRAALSIANLLVIPFRPRSFDVWTLTQVRKLFEGAKKVNSGLEACVVINQADPRGLDNKTACEIIAEIPHFRGSMAILTHLKAFANASADGLAVIERTGGTPKAKDEIDVLYSTIYD
jgi:chromosome partitioning protein